MNVRRTSVLLLLCSSLLLATSLHAQIPISNSAPTYSQNFDAIGTTAAAPLPAGFKVDKQSVVRTPGSYAAAATATTLLGGANLSSSASNGIYNFGAGTNTTGSDRAVGFLSSGTATQSGNLYAAFTNSGSSPINGLTLSYVVEKYRGGSNPAGFRIQLYTSTDGTTWSDAGAAFTTSFAADAANTGYATAPGDSRSVSGQQLSVTIPAGGNLYLAWNYSVASGTTTTNAQALAIDSITVTAGGTPGSTPLKINSATATPATVSIGASTVIAAAIAPAVPANGSVTVTANLSSIGGSASQALNDAGTDGDATAGDGVYSFSAVVANGTTGGAKTITVTATDASTTQTANVALSVTAPTNPTGSGTATPASLQPNATTLLTVTVTPGANPPSSGLSVTADLSAIGGSSSQLFYDDGTHGDVTAGNNVFSFLATVGSVDAGTRTLPVTITDGQSRSGSASISLQVQPPPPPTTVKISQVYGGGGNSGSTFTNDFVELFNQGTTPVSLAGWSVQYHSAGSDNTAWSVADLCPTSPCVIQPGHYFLVQGVKGNGGTTSLPAPDVTSTLSMGGSNGKVALVASLTPIAGNACTSGGTLVDLVGYGTSTCFLGSAAAPALDASSAAVRRHNGCTDSGDNRNDFVAVGPIPRNSSSPVNDCSSDPTQLHGFATADSVEPAGQTRITVSVVAASAPASTNIGVSADLTSIGGAASQSLYDDGTHGDSVAGDNTFSFEATVALATPTGVKNIPATVSDAQGRSAAVPVTMSVVSPTCGIERWSVKVGVDPDAPQVDLNNPLLTDIVTLRGIPAPATPPDNARVLPTEGTVYVVNGTMTLFKKEDDVDYHIVVQDANGKTIVTEIPAPPCIVTTASPRVAAPSPFSSGINLARTKFDARFTANSFFQSVTVPVQVTGVGFFDFIHGQTGVAPNGIELHPLLDINFTNDTTTTLVSSANPSQYGQTVSVTATVSNGGITVPTGKVTFLDGGVATVAVTLNGGQATYSTNGLSVGSHSITATYEGDSTSAPSASTALVQVIGRADQSITFTPIGGKTFGDADFALTASASSALPVTFTLVSGPATITGGSVHITGAGTVTVRASQGGDGNYNAAADVDQSFVVAPAQPAVVVTGGTFPYDRATHPATAAATGIGGAALAGQFTFTYNGSAGAPTNAGAYEVVATFTSDDANYSTAVGHGTLTITKVAPSIGVSGGPFTYDATAKTATATASGVGGEAVPGTFVITYNGASSAVNAGTYAVAVAFTSSSSNYTNATGSGSITIAAALPTVTVGGGPFVYDGTPKSAVAVAHGVGNTIVAGTFALTYDGSPVPPTSAGAYSVIALFSSSDANYLGATGTGGILINKAMPTVVVTGGPFMYDGSPKTAVATATGIGGATVSGTFTFTYNGSAVAPTNPGVYSVVAAFVSSDANYSNTTGTGSIVIRGLRDEIQDELTALGKLRDATTKKQDLDKLNDAIKHLANALEPDLWLDTIHVTAAEGDEVFTESKNSVIPLLMLSRDANSSVPQAALKTIVSRIATDDRLLAMTAINDAAARGANVAKSQADLTRGDADVASGQFESAIEHYRSAWASAMK